MTLMFRRMVFLLASVSWAAPPMRYVAIGDSFTIGTSVEEQARFPSQLAQKLRDAGIDVTLVNLAINGHSTNEVLTRQIPRVAAFRPSVVTLAIGANDIVRERAPDAYAANLKAIFTALAGTKAKVFVLPQPDWSLAPAAEAFGTQAELRSRIETYNAILRQSAQAHGATYVDVWPENVKSAQAGEFSADGLHPTARLYGLWAQRLLPVF
jgi:lysophospholipase L1-like esterase